MRRASFNYSKYLMIGFPGRLHFLWQPREQGWCSWSAAGQGEWSQSSQSISTTSAAAAHPRMLMLFLYCSVKQRKSPWEVPDA